MAKRKFTFKVSHRNTLNETEPKKKGKGKKSKKEKRRIRQRMERYDREDD